MFSFTPFSPSDDPQELFDAGMPTPPPTGVTIGEFSYVGVDGQASTFTDKDETLGIQSGFLLTTGYGSPETSNTSTSLSWAHYTAGDDDLTDVVEVPFPEAGGTNDANILEFVVFVENPEVEGISFDVVFGSDEYPEYVESYVDIAAVFVNGENVATFDDDPERPLSVLPSNDQYFIDNDTSPASPPGSANLPIEYDAVSIRLQASAPLQQGVNVIKIAIADTGDYSVDSGLFVGNIRFLGDTGGGGLNVPPVAGDDGYTIDEDGKLVVDEGSVLDNDTDFDEDPLTAVLASEPKHGTLEFNPDGTFTYIPAPDFNGTDSFTYEVTDPKGGTDSGTVTITVNPVADPPAAKDDAYSVAAGVTLKVVAQGGVLANDTDPDGGSIAAELLKGPAHGTLTLKANGAFTYTPAAGFSGEDSFTYEAVDPQGNRTPATVVIDVTAIGAPPVIEEIGAAGMRREGDLITFTVFASDEDEEEGLTYAFDFDGDGEADVVNGSGVAKHAFDDNGGKSVSVTVTDSNGNVATETLELDIANAPPVVALSEEPQVDGGKVKISGTITDPGTGDSFEVVIDWGEKGPGRFETLTFEPSPNGKQKFTATHTYEGAGEYTIKARVTDDDGGTDVDVIGIEIENQAPTVTLDPVSPIKENGVAVLTGTVGDRDAGETLTLKVDWGDETTIEKVVLEDAGSGSTFRLTHVYRDDRPGGLDDTYEITATVLDGRGGRDEATRTAVVRNVAPEIDGGTRAELPGGGPVSYSSQVGFSGAFADVGSIDEHDITIRWGDGKTTSTTTNPDRFEMVRDAGGTRFKTTHNYSEGGVYRIGTVVKDDDGGSDVKLQKIFVAGMRLSDDGEILIIADQGASHVYLFTDRGPSGNEEAGLGAAPASNNLVVVNTDIRSDVGGTYERSDVERVFFRGSEARDTFVLLDGIAEETLILGRGGADDLRGGSSRDHIKGGNGSDLLFGQLGRDTIDGGFGNDEIFGDFDAPGIGGSDVLIGRKGNDTIIGGAGGDDISGNMGRDWLAGGFGQDSVSGGAGSDVLFGDDDTFAPENGPLAGREGGPSALRIRPGDDVPDVVERTGDAGDIMDGGAGNDLMFGQGGDDEMSGGSGDDTMSGGQGNDLLRLGGGANVVVFDRGDGRDTVEGFTRDDVIDLTELDRAVIGDAADVLDRAQQVEEDVVLDLGGGDQIRLVGVSLTSLTEDAFLV